MTTGIKSMTRQRRRIVALAALALVGGLLPAGQAHGLSGGAAAAEGAFPFLARITMDGRGCSGALISTEWVITAASCFPENPQGGVPSKATTVIVGNVNLATGTGRVVPVTKLVRRSDRDVMLAKLATPVTDVAVLGLGATAPTQGEALKVAGFGRTATDWVPDRPRVAPFSVNSVTGTTALLAGANGVDACKGDAGGPVFRETSGRVELVGVSSNSWQHGCLLVTETRQGSTQARTDDLVAWINQQIVPTAVQCGTGAPIWAARNDGTLWLYKHNDPAEGAFNWDQPVASIGQGWFGRIVAAPGGVIWDVHKRSNANDPEGDGVLKRWVWSGTGWTGGTQVGSGWQAQLTPEARNLMTVDDQGRLYAINGQGELRVFIWNVQTNTWVNAAGELIDSGWGKFNSITAAGDGVLYARDPGGSLFRFQYDMSSRTWVQRDKGSGFGWQVFREIFSPGADILYGRGGVGPDPGTGVIGPVLRWYRYSANTDTWAPGASDGQGKVVGTGWDTEIHVAAMAASCFLVK
jgi:V8-like Glu-specific endopeptidase